MSWKDAFRAALPAALVATAVTLLRLAGELRGWSEAWFSRATGGFVPASAVGWVVGITWLALPFGAWFAWRLARSGAPKPQSGRALLLAALAVVVIYGGGRLAQALGSRAFQALRMGLLGYLLPIWTVAILAALLAWRAWPALGRVLLAYGVLSRAVVAVVMFLALRGQWGTHYDYADAPGLREMPFWTAYVLLAFVPQLVFWVAYTIVLGMLGGTLARALAPGSSGVRRGAAGTEDAEGRGR
jgi:hypothetical protein